MSDPTLSFVDTIQLTPLHSNLSKNNLNGPIPSSIGYITYLNQLYIANVTIPWISIVINVKGIFPIINWLDPFPIVLEIYLTWKACMYIYSTCRFFMYDIDWTLFEKGSFKQCIKRTYSWIHWQLIRIDGLVYLWYYYNQHINFLDVSTIINWMDVFLHLLVI